MTKEGKVIIAFIVGTIILIGGLAFLMTKSSGGGSGRDSLVPNIQAVNLEASPSGIMNLGQISYGGGKVTRSFDIKNTSDKTIKLRKITTSCMCTVAKVKIGNKETKSFGMEMNGDLNPLIDLDLPAGETAEAAFTFDPTAHGPSGIGVIDRQITLSFDVGYKVLEFSGDVVK